LQNNSGLTALEIATNKGYESIINFLLMKGASLTIINETTKQTPLHVAALMNRINLVEIFIQTCKNNNNINIFNHKDIDGNTPLILAAENNNIEIIKLLLSAESEIDIENNKGDNVLHVTCKKGYVECVKLVCSPKVINIKNQEGFFPIHLAVMKGFIEIVQYLLTQQCAINAKDNEGNTPLHHAFINKHYDIATLLCENGASLSLMNNEGKSALEYAPSKKQNSFIDRAKSSSEWNI
jgi:ankyrin repeat protein